MIWESRVKIHDNAFFPPLEMFCALTLEAGGLPFSWCDLSVVRIIFDFLIKTNKQTKNIRNADNRAAPVFLFRALTETLKSNGHTMEHAKILVTNSAVECTATKKQYWVVKGFINVLLFKPDMR